jgi:hypothetical protein
VLARYTVEIITQLSPLTLTPRHLLVLPIIAANILLIGGSYQSMAQFRVTYFYSLSLWRKRDGESKV